MVGGKCMDPLHRLLHPHHLPVPPGSSGEQSRVRSPVLDRLPRALALEALDDAGLHLPLLHPRHHHRQLLRRHRDHHLEEGPDDAGA